MDSLQFVMFYYLKLLLESFLIPPAPQKKEEVTLGIILGNWRRLKIVTCALYAKLPRDTSKKYLVDLHSH